jgi:hypothetical protein
MRRWGMLITLAYCAILVLFLLPLAAFLNASFGSDFISTFVKDIGQAYGSLGTWIVVGIAIAGQALLLFLSVDTSFQKLKPRSHILLSCLLTAGAAALLTGAAVLCVGFGIWGDHFGGHFFDTWFNLGYVSVTLWLIWAVVFFIYFRKPGALISKTTSWLLRGSVLELLIAVPAHVIARRRNDCSAPVATSFGIVTGIAIMLLCFGPSVLLLYKKRLDEYGARRAAAG